MLSKISQKLISDPLSVIVHHSSEKKFNYNITGKLLGPSVIFYDNDSYDCLCYYLIGW